MLVCEVVVQVECEMVVGVLATAVVWTAAVVGDSGSTIDPWKHFTGRTPCLKHTAV